MKKLNAEQAAKTEARKAAFHALDKTIKGKTKEELEELVRQFPVITAEGRALSIHNNCLVIAQRGTATVVGGYKQWLAHGRQVNKGEKGLCIWIHTSKKAENPGELDKTYFVMGNVFDISQTTPVTAETTTNEKIV